MYQHASQLSKDQASASAKELNIKIRTLQKVLKMNTAKQQKEVNGGPGGDKAPVARRDAMRDVGWGQVVWPNWSQTHLVGIGS